MEESKMYEINKDSIEEILNPTCRPFSRKYLIFM